MPASSEEQEGIGEGDSANCGKIRCMPTLPGALAGMSQGRRRVRGLNREVGMGPVEPGRDG